MMVNHRAFGRVCLVVAVVFGLLGAPTMGFAQREAVQIAGCGVDYWEWNEHGVPCVFDNCETCDTQGLTASYRSKINDVNVDFAELTDWNNDGETTGWFLFDPQSPEFGLELPAGITVAEVFVEGGLFFGSMGMSRHLYTDMLPAAPGNLVERWACPMEAASWHLMSLNLL